MRAERVFGRWLIINSTIFDKWLIVRPTRVSVCVCVELALSELNYWIVFLLGRGVFPHTLVVLVIKMLGAGFSSSGGNWWRRKSGVDRSQQHFNESKRRAQGFRSKCECLFIFSNRVLGNLCFRCRLGKTGDPPGWGYNKTWCHLEYILISGFGLSNKLFLNFWF